MSPDLKTPDKTRPREIFLGALEKNNPSEQAVFLDAACAGDKELRKRVEELLGEEKEIGTFLETPALSTSGTPAPAPARGPGGTVLMAALTEKPGDSIGRYKLLQKIGEGGCGVVYMAEQEKPVRRRVALKIIKLGMDTKQVIARFEAERQALALMDHPNIAKVLEAGSTETGRPYFVMELVRGIKITEYCDQNNLPTRERLDLFVQVCNAIQHAHQKGIIHRDIKPSNILVTSHDGTPVPKIIDFGIAKATNQQRLTDLTIFTAFEQFIGTPAYMSPEQAEMSGLDIDTRSDIYSLGVLLYELLTGKTPFDAETLISSGLDECRRTIREEEPVWPSTRLATLLDAELTITAKHQRAEPPRLINLLRGDLDWIVMKAIEKDRTRRFATANELAMDVDRYLKDQPVLARPPSNWYRFQKLFRRHNAVFAAIGAIAVTLFAGAGISIWLAVRATKAQHDARKAQLAEIQSRQSAESQQKRASEQASLARLNEYVADINLAQQSLFAGNFGRAVQLLNKHRPQTGETDLRGFEWRYLWQLARGDEHVALPSQGGAVHTLAVSPHGDLLTIGLPDKLTIWDLHKKTLIKTIPEPISSVAFSVDGKSLFTSGSAIRVWNTSDWTVQKTLDRNFGAMTLSPDGSRLAAMSKGVVNVWDTSTWAKTVLLRGARGPLAFSPDGKRLATDADAGISVWELRSGVVQSVLEGSTNLFFAGGPWLRDSHVLAFSPDGKFIVAPRNTRSVRGVFVLSIWDAQSGKESGMLPSDPEHIEHTGIISSLAFSPDGRTLATGSMDHSIRLWDFGVRQPSATLHGHLNEVWAVAFAPDGETLASGGKDGGVKLWPARREKKDDILTSGRRPLAFSRNSRTLAALEPSANMVVFLNPLTGESEQQFQLEPERRGPRHFQSSVSFSADLSTMAEPTTNGYVKIWNTQTREVVLLKASDAPLDLTVLSPDGHQLIAGGFQQPLRWWDLISSTNQMLGTRGRRAVFSPNGRTLAVFGWDPSLQLWDVATRSLRTNFTFESSAIFGVVFSPDGSMIATSGGPDEVDNAIRLWSATTGKPLGVFTGHKQGVWSMAFSPDGRTLASSSDDSTLKLWSISTQQELLSIPRLGGPMTDLLFSPDGLLLAGANGRFFESTGIRVYRAPRLDETEMIADGSKGSL